MNYGWIVALLAASWCCLTLGAFMVSGSWAVVPLSLGLAFGLVGFVYARASIVATLHTPPQESKK